MLPLDLIRRFREPKEFEKMFINYLEKAGAKIENNKTIAPQILYHAKATLTAVKRFTFFEGELDPSATNITGNSFVRPTSEHFLITEIRLSRGNADIASESTYQRGQVDFNDVINNAVMTLTCNGVVCLKNMPTNMFDGDSLTNEIGTLLLDQPILWEGSESLEIVLETKGPNDFVDETYRIDLVGIGLIS